MYWTTWYFHLRSTQVNNFVKRKFNSWKWFSVVMFFWSFILEKVFSGTDLLINLEVWQGLAILFLKNLMIMIFEISCFFRMRKISTFLRLWNYKVKKLSSKCCPSGDFRVWYISPLSKNFFLFFFRQKGFWKGEKIWKKNDWNSQKLCMNHTLFQSSQRINLFSFEILFWRIGFKQNWLLNFSAFIGSSLMGNTTQLVFQNEQFLT